VKALLTAVSLVALAACSDATSPVPTSADVTAPLAIAADLKGDANDKNGDGKNGNGRTVVVTESDISRQVENSPPLRNWVFYTRPGAGTGVFRVGPDNPPLGKGSFEVRTPGPLDKVTLFNYDHVGTELASITAMSYFTYKPTGAAPISFPSINMQIDKTGGTFMPGDFSTLVFEPYNQPGFADAYDVWQFRDAYNGGSAKWWSTRPLNPLNPLMCSQAIPCPWSTLVSLIPNATILGGYGINAGSGNPLLIGAVDALRIANGKSITYDFELTRKCKKGDDDDRSAENGGSCKDKGDDDN